MVQCFFRNSAARISLFRRSTLSEIVFERKASNKTAQLTEKNSFVEAECSVYRRLPKWRISCLWWTFIGWNEQSLWEYCPQTHQIFCENWKALCFMFVVLVLRKWLLLFSDVLFFLHLVTVHGNSCLSSQKEQVKTLCYWGHQLFVLAFITISL